MNFWCVSFVYLILSLATISICTAESLDLENKFNDTEYNIQLKDMIVEINKLDDDVGLGRITQETANKTAASLIDDPRYNQVKLKKQIVEREHEILLRNERPPLPNCTASLTNSLLNPIGLSNTIYYYPYVGEMRVYSDGWGVGYAEAIKHVRI